MPPVVTHAIESLQKRLATGDGELMDPYALQRIPRHTDPLPTFYTQAQLDSYVYDGVQETVERVEYEIHERYRHQREVHAQEIAQLSHQRDSLLKQCVAIAACQSPAPILVPTGSLVSTAIHEDRKKYEWLCRNVGSITFCDDNKVCYATPQSPESREEARFYDSVDALVSGELHDILTDQMDADSSSRPQSPIRHN